MKQGDIYTLITNRIIEKMENGVIPWTRGFTSQLPQNFISKKPYNGINYWITRCNSFVSPYYLTYKQAKELGGSIKTGEKGTPIVFWQILEKETISLSGEKIKKKIPLLKYYTVFNAEQCAGIEFPTVENKIRNVELLDKLILEMNEQPEILHRSDYLPCYAPYFDQILMPVKCSFFTSARYYKTLLHEIGHWTGAERRLNREGVAKLDNFGSHKYSKEELVAELVAAYAMNYAGLEGETESNSAAYIKSWLKVLKSDHKFIFRAAKEAEVAWKFINNQVSVPLTKSEAA